MVLSSMFDVWHAFPCSHSVLNVTVTPVVSWNAEIIAAKGYYFYCTLWFMAENQTELLVESVPWAHISVWTLHSELRWTPSYLFKVPTTFAISMTWNLPSHSEITSRGSVGSTHNEADGSWLSYRTTIHPCCFSRVHKLWWKSRKVWAGGFIEENFLTIVCDVTQDK